MRLAHGRRCSREACELMQLDDVLAAADKGLPADLKTRLDELTFEYRLGDDPR